MTKSRQAEPTKTKPIKAKFLLYLRTKGLEKEKNRLLKLIDCRINRKFDLDLSAAIEKLVCGFVVCGCIYNDQAGRIAGGADMTGLRVLENCSVILV